MQDATSRRVLELYFRGDMPASIAQQLLPRPLDTYQPIPENTGSENDDGEPGPGSLKRKNSGSDGSQATS